MDPNQKETDYLHGENDPKPTDMLLTVAEIDYDERNLNGSFSYLCKQLQLNNLDIDNWLTKAKVEIVHPKKTFIL